MAGTTFGVGICLEVRPQGVHPLHRSDGLIQRRLGVAAIEARRVEMVAEDPFSGHLFAFFNRRMDITP
jgi:hypothetical protein